MRSFFLTSLAVVGLAGTTLAHSAAATAAGRSRKSLGFGAVHPNAGLKVSKVIPVNSFAPVNVDPIEVARAHVLKLTKDIPNASFVVREDSYTDKATGVTHVYVRQLVNGIEVADGDFNVNIKDGQVISYGDSFYRGLPTPVQNADPQAEYCFQLQDHHDSQVMQYSAGSQVSLSEELHPLPHLLSSNCAPKPAPFAQVSSGSPEEALLRFMAEATPNEEVVQDIAVNYEKHLKGMMTSMHTNLVDGQEQPFFMIENVPDAVNPVKARLAYVQVPNGKETQLVLTYKFEVEMRDNWYEAAVSAEAPHNIISVVDWASDAYVPGASKKKGVPKYNVFGWGINDPSEGERSIYQQAPDSLASPAGWHSFPKANDPKYFNARLADPTAWTNSTTTWGNNVFAHEDWEGRNNYIHNYRPDGGEDLVFDFKYNPKETTSSDALDEAKKYINATVTQLFFTTNMVHDLYYRYGFDEVSGNFQQYNFGRGGKENDAVIANAQDGSGYNNANFMTPPDGQNGRCRMYLWNTANPYRDGDLEAGIVIHELSHGLSTRLTGGPANSGCLGWGESGGMGEGWGDFIATTIRSTPEYHDYSMGEWAANRVGGIRNYVYSLDETINPSTYSTLDKPGYWGVHAIGEVWAEILWVVSQKMIAKHGFSDTLFPPEPSADGTIPEGNFYRPRQVDAMGKPKPLVPKHGNTLFLQLVLDGMKLQPCRPSFFDARDAIIQADDVLTGGENYCTLWRGFAARGLGPDARVDGRTPWGGGVRTNDYNFPKACAKEDA